MLSTCIVTDGVLPTSHVVYSTIVCGCKIMDVACACCGMLLGYYVYSICRSCISRNHNGNRYVFQPKALKVQSNNHILKRLGRGFLDLTPRDLPGR
jgi:hypothetical protein